MSTGVVNANTALGRTLNGRKQQIDKAFNGIAANIKHRQAEAPADAPLSASQYRAIIADLEQQLADAGALIEEMRRSANSDAPAAISSTRYWSAKRVSKESNCAICTVCRNAVELGGVKIGADWMFPTGTTYGGRKRGKPKKAV